MLSDRDIARKGLTVFFTCFFFQGNDQYETIDEHSKQYYLDNSVCNGNG